MTQEISLDVDFSVTAAQLQGIARLGRQYPHHDIRVSGDAGPESFLKVYVGPYYRETHRYWVEPDGKATHVEKDHAVHIHDDADWKSVTLQEAYLALIKIMKVPTKTGEAYQ